MDQRLVPALPRKMRSWRIVLPVSFLALFALWTNVSAQSGDKLDPLKPLTTCKLAGDLRIKQVDRKGKPAEDREVETDKGQERVSVLDGYRVMFAYKDLRYFFANVKIEQSDAQRYANDKEVIIRSLKHLATTKQASKIIVADKTNLNGFEHYGVDRDAIDIGGVIGTHVLFYDARQLVITVYLLNQEKDRRNILFENKRRFNDIKEYRELRDNFLNEYSACLQQVSK